MEVEVRGAKRKLSAGAKTQKYTAKTRAKVISDQQIKQVIAKQGEMKYYTIDQGVTAVPISTAASTGVPLSFGGNTNLFQPATGNTVTDRIGNKVKLHTIRIKISLKFLAQALTAGGLNASAVRITLVRDKEPQGATYPTLADIYRSSGVAASQILALQTATNFGRFEVIYDKVKILQDPNLQTTGFNGHEMVFKIEKHYPTPVTVKFATSTTVAITDTWLLYAQADDIGLVPMITAVSRCCFKEE